MRKDASLAELLPGERARVRGLAADGAMRRRLLDLGLVDDTEVDCVGRGPWGSPKAFRIRGAIIALRTEDCRDVLIYTG